MMDNIIVDNIKEIIINTAESYIPNTLILSDHKISQVCLRKLEYE